MKNCDNCGTQCEDEQKFCFQCGAKFEESKSNNKLLWLIVGLVIIAVGLFSVSVPNKVNDCSCFAPVKVNDKYGFINSNGDIVIEPQFYSVCGSFEDGYVGVASSISSNGEEKNWGIIDKQGRYVVKPQYGNLIDTPAKNVYKVSQKVSFLNGKNYDSIFEYFKYIDVNGKELFNGQLFSMKHRDHLPYANILFDNLVEWTEWYDNETYDIKTFDGKVLKKKLINSNPLVGNFMEGRAFILEKKAYSTKVFAIDTNFNILLEFPKWLGGDDLDCFEIVKGSFGGGFVGYSSNRYTSIFSFDEKHNLDRFKYNCHTWKIDDENGKELLKLKANKISAFKNGYAVYVNNEIGESGLIDLNGNIALKYKDQDGQVYGHVGKNGLVPFKKNGKCGFIDVKGNEIIPCKYSRVGSFGE